MVFSNIKKSTSVLTKCQTNWGENHGVRDGEDEMGKADPTRGDDHPRSATNFGSCLAPDTSHGVGPAIPAIGLERVDYLTESVAYPLGCPTDPGGRNGPPSGGFAKPGWAQAARAKSPANFSIRPPDAANNERASSSAAMSQVIKDQSARSEDCAMVSPSGNARLAHDISALKPPPRKLVEMRSRGFAWRW
jgi:hypothetical protein